MIRFENVEGESAQTRLKRKERLDITEAIAIATHIATALETGWRKAHLIHRDIKPDNILLSNDGEEGASPARQGSDGRGQTDWHLPSFAMI